MAPGTTASNAPTASLLRVLAAGVALTMSLSSCAAESEADGAVCDPADYLSDGTLREARESVPDCVVLSEPGAIYEARCGALHAVYVGGIDSGSTRYYDSTGKLVGENEDWSFLPGPRWCRSFDPSFTAPPEDCVRVTPEFTAGTR